MVPPVIERRYASLQAVCEHSVCRLDSLWMDVAGLTPLDITYVPWDGEIRSTSFLTGLDWPWYCLS